MHRDYVSKLLNRFKKDELLDLLIQKGYLDANSAGKKGTKATIVNRMLKRCHGKLTNRQTAELDLIYHQNHPSSREWNVHFLAGFDINREKKQDLRDASVLERVLHNRLRFYFQLDTYVQSYQDALWIRLAISDVFKRNALPSTIYMVYYPSSPYLMTTGIKDTHKEYIYQVLCDTLGCTNIKQLQLSGKNVYSLADMVLNSTSQGSYSNYRANQLHDNPLLQGTLAKRKKSCEDGEENSSDDRVIEENKSANKENKTWIESTFGTNNKQPVLEKVTFTLDTKFKGTSKLNFHKENFKCTVKFEGPSVIEGIKNLGKTGIAELPLPPYLANIQSSTRNHFTLVNRKRQRQNESS